MAPKEVALQIPNDLIAAAEAVGIRGPTEEQRTAEEIVRLYPDWALWAVGQHPEVQGLLSPKQIDRCAEARPWAALRYAAGLLSPERLDACAADAPMHALRYAAEWITPMRVDLCAAAEPWAALAHAAARLSPERLDACATIAPRLALRYAAGLLSPERRAWCEERIRC